MVRVPLPEVIIPAFGLGVPPSRVSAIVVAGLPRFIWLNAFRKSARNWSRRCSRNLKAFMALISQFHRPGPHNMSRAEFPHVHFAGGANAAVLNQRTAFLRSCPGCSG